ncbi:MAG: glycosyltransferase [Myxacorys chilensis ATA2-1-KO14]|jgi:GT2 family glycosyltransferase|nr:glycosyltransferase [Myxacorys chilensis ATA2-1-KO14]
MPYAIRNIEITQPLPSIELDPSEQGIALIVRRSDRPLGFLMQPLPEGSILSSDAIAEWIGRKLGVKILQDSIRDELGVTLDVTTFPTLTVAICTKDRPVTLARCLDSLLKLQKADAEMETQFEILVVDNAPSDARTHDLVLSLPTVRYTREPKPGLNFARNRAVQATTTELLAFLDDDVVVDRYWLNGLTEAWIENPDAGAVTGQVMPYELATKAQILFEQRGGFRRGFNKIRYGQVMPHNRVYPCDTGSFGVGCNMSFRCTVLDKIGGFDEALDTGAPLPGGGDHDILYQVIRAGFPLAYEPGYLVFHQHRQSYAKLRHQYWTWGLSLMAFVVKAYRSDPPMRDRWLGLVRWWFANQLRLLAKSLVGRHSLPADLVLTEFWGGVIGLLGEYGRSQHRSEKIRRQY